MTKRFLMACLAVLSGASLCLADGSSFKGQFVYDGAPPPQLELTGATGPSAKDKADCGDPNLKVMNETLVVDATSKGIANVFVYLSPPPTGGKKPPLPSDNDALKAMKMTFDNKMLRFEPHVLVVQSGQEVELSNSDKVGHNIKIDFGGLANPASNDSLAAGAKITKKFAKEERLPAQVSCSIHPYMKSWLLVRDNPYFAVADKDGKFEIKNVPDGEWQFQVWQEKAGYLTKVKVGGKAATWARGRVTQKFAGKDVDLGAILVSEENFKGK
jgi:plastocyanin